MKHITTLALSAAVAAFALPAYAQTPAKTAADNPAPAASFKRTADGHPDFSGAWTRGGVMGVPGPGIRAINDARGICVINCGPAADVNPGATPGAAPAAPVAIAARVEARPPMFGP